MNTADNKAPLYLATCQVRCGYDSVNHRPPSSCHHHRHTHLFEVLWCASVLAHIPTIHDCADGEEHMTSCAIVLERMHKGTWSMARLGDTSWTCYRARCRKRGSVRTLRGTSTGSGILVTIRRAERGSGELRWGDTGVDNQGDCVGGDDRADRQRCPRNYRTSGKFLRILGTVYRNDYKLLKPALHESRGL